MPSSKPERPQTAASAPQKPSRDTATFTPYFWEAYNEIVNPRRFNHYLLARWLPELGAVGLAIVLTLRDRCYWHRDDGVLRNETEVSMEELAAAIGVERTTIHRQFKNNEALALFVRKLAQYKMVDGKPRKIENAYQVAMDEPIHPDDYDLYEALKEAKSQQESSGVRIKREGNNSTLQSATYKDSCTLQNATQQLQNATLNTILQIATSNDELLSEGLNTLDNATGGEECPPINPPGDGQDALPDATATHAEVVWESVCQELEGKMPIPSFKAWVLPSRLEALTTTACPEGTHTTATIRAGTKFGRDQLDGKWSEALAAAFAQVVGRPVRVAFVAGK